MTNRCDCGAKVGDAHLGACFHAGIVTEVHAAAKVKRLNERFNVAALDGLPIPDDVIMGQGPFVTPRSNYDYIFNRMPKVDLTGGPGMGKSKLMKKWIKKMSKKDRKKFKWTKLNKVRVKPEDISGFLVPSVTPQGKWDLRDEDGDLHSPSWYLDAYLVSRQEYHEALSTDMRDMDAQQDMNHMSRLDDLKKELDMYENYINRLFNYSTE